MINANGKENHTNENHKTEKTSMIMIGPRLQTNKNRKKDPVGKNGQRMKNRQWPQTKKTQTTTNVASNHVKLEFMSKTWDSPRLFNVHEKPLPKQAANALQWCAVRSSQQKCATKSLSALNAWRRPNRVVQRVWPKEWIARCGNIWQRATIIMTRALSKCSKKPQQHRAIVLPWQKRVFELVRRKQSEAREALAPWRFRWCARQTDRWQWTPRHNVWHHQSRCVRWCWTNARRRGGSPAWPARWQPQGASCGRLGQGSTGRQSLAKNYIITTFVESRYWLGVSADTNHRKIVTFCMWHSPAKAPSWRPGTMRPLSGRSPLCVLGKGAGRWQGTLARPCTCRCSSMQTTSSRQKSRRQQAMQARVWESADCPWIDLGAKMGRHTMLPGWEEGIQIDRSTQYERRRKWRLEDGKAWILRCTTHVHEDWTRVLKPFFSQQYNPPRGVRANGELLSTCKWWTDVLTCHCHQTCPWDPTKHGVVDILCDARGSPPRSRSHVDFGSKESRQSYDLLREAAWSPWSQAWVPHHVGAPAMTRVTVHYRSVRLLWDAFRSDITGTPSFLSTPLPYFLLWALRGPPVTGHWPETGNNESREAANDDWANWSLDYVSICLERWGWSNGQHDKRLGVRDVPRLPNMCRPIGQWAMCPSREWRVTSFVACVLCVLRAWAGSWPAGHQTRAM